MIRMDEYSYIKGIIDGVQAIGHLLSAVAIEFKGERSFLGWYKSVAYHETESIEILGAAIRICKEEDKDLLSEKIGLTFGKPEEIIHKIPFISLTFRHLNLEERVELEKGYNNPELYRELVKKYDLEDGKYPH